MRTSDWKRWMAVCIGAWLTASSAARAHDSSQQSRPTPQAAAKKPSATELAPFKGTLEEAEKEAFARNVPLVIFATLDGEDSNDRYAKAFASDPAMAAAAEGAVVLIVNSGQHETKKLDVTVNGKKSTREVCSKFLTLTCAEHQRNWDPVFLAFNDKGELQCPVVLLVQPDKKLARRLAPGDGPKATQVASALASLVEKVGPGLTQDELGLVQRALADAKKAEDGGNQPDAWRSYAAVIAVSAKVRYADEAREGEARAMTSIDKQRDAALAALDGDKPEEGYAALVDLASRCKGLPNEKDLAKAIARAETAPATREAIGKYKHEQAAEALWKEALELEAAKQPAKAEAKLKTILRKFADTGVAVRTKRKYPDVAKAVEEEDAAKKK